MDWRSEYDDVLLLKLLLGVEWFNKVIFVFVVVGVLVVDEVTIGLVEVEGVY